MRRIKINAATPYEVLVGTDLLKDCGKYIKETGTKAEKLFLVSETNVAPLHLDKTKASLEEAGFELRLPSCSSCLAMNPDKVPAGKLSISTSNRNFVGRQGPGARTVLASPLVVAASAITGVITDPRNYEL